MDLTKLSDADLQKLYAQTAPAQGSPQAMSDQELMQARQAKPSYSGSILPFTRDENGVRFDPNAGIVGSLMRAFTLGGDVYSGKIDPKSDEGIARATEMAGVISPVNPAIRAGDKLIPGVASALKREKVPAPSAEALYEASGKAYDAARNLGVDYSSDAVSRMAGNARLMLEKDGLIGKVAPQTLAILQELEAPPAGSVAPLTGLEAARRSLGHVARNFNSPPDQLAAKRVMEQLDQFMSRPPAEGVVAGPAPAAGKLIEEARGNYAAAKRSDRLTGLEEDADRRAAAANSGQNTGNAIRGRVASLLQSDKSSAGYNPEEIAALEAVARGNLGRNMTRYLGNLLGGGGGLGAALTGAGGAGLGAAVGDPSLAAIGAVAGPAVGFAAKQADNMMTRRALNQADEMVRSRSPLAEALAAAQPMTRDVPDARAALIRALIAAEADKRVQ